ncbi:MAG: sugar transferase [Deltaproteobacteria bacterium]|nr:sugar transferase [Deltaproteobacteria bacterium]
MNQSDLKSIELLTGEKWGKTRSSLYSNYLKRGLDLLLIVLSLPFFIPLMLFLSLWIKLDSKGPIVYSGQRIGKDGKAFSCFKFRTMHPNADQILDELLKNNPNLQEEWKKDQKLRQDPRVTRAGKWIRKLSIDELPQVFNILRGDMSWVGPRPIVKDEIIRYGDKFSYYKQVRPGLTGLWQVSGRNHTSYEERVNLDMFYAQKINLLLDLKIILKTLPAVLFSKGAY